MDSDDFSPDPNDLEDDISEVVLYSKELKLMIKSAKFKRDVEFLGKQDPFAQFNYGGELLKTQVIDGGGKQPVWDETFELKDI